jgi:hypothetical protein
VPAPVKASHTTIPIDRHFGKKQKRTERFHVFELHRPDGIGYDDGLGEGGHARAQAQDKTEPTAELSTCDRHCHDRGKRPTQCDEEGAEPRQISEERVSTSVNEHQAFNQAYQENGEPWQGLEAAVKSVMRCKPFVR